MHVPIPHFNSIWLILLTWAIILSQYEHLWIKHPVCR
jgi:hypothetical protein